MPISECKAVGELLQTILGSPVGHGIGEGISLVDVFQDRAAHAQNVAGEDTQAHLLALQRAVQEPPRDFLDADDFPAETADGPLHNNANGGVEARSIAAAGQNTDSFDFPADHVPS